MSHYPQQQYHQSPLHQQQAYLPSEDDQFRSFFRSHLATLVINSRPIIGSLTQVAADQQNNYGRATVVSEELVRRIHEAPPHQKLPPFYLLDSISKNFPAPYASLFPPFLQLLFLATYASVDGSTKGKMEEMLKTWRNGGVGGGVVFGVDVQAAIEERIWGSKVAEDLRAQHAPQHYYQPPSSHQYPPIPPAIDLPPAPTADALLVHLAVALHRSHQLQQSASPPSSIANDILALQSLQALIRSQPTTEDERRAIDAQLKKMDADAAPLPPSPPPRPPPPAVALPAFDFLSAPGFSNLLSNVLANTQGGASPRPAVVEEQEDEEYVVPEASEDEGSVVGQGDSEVEVVEKVPMVEEPDDYESMILGLNVKLTTLDLKAPLPRFSTILATLLPSQCRQCSVRAPSSAKGRARLDTHMDWHYRHNKRARDSEGRGNSRAWFVDAKDWIKDASISPDSFLPSSTANPSSTDTSGAGQQSGLTPAARAALSKKFVVQPADPEVAARGCPICKEPFKGEFSEDEEEWIWKNAVEHEGIYHATCRHETLNASSTLLTTRLRTSTIATGDSTPANRSRSNSPALPAHSASHPPSTTSSPLQNGSAAPAGDAGDEDVVVKVEELEIAPAPAGGKRKSMEPSRVAEEGGDGAKKIKLEETAATKEGEA